MMNTFSSEMTGSISSIDPIQFRQQILSYVDRLNTGRVGEYRMWAQGQVALFPSCFAAMTLHYLDALANHPTEERHTWIDYLNSWQDPNTGLFIGPELARGEASNPQLDFDYTSLILTGRVLPALHILGGRPTHPIRAIDPYLDMTYLQRWLEARDWHYAWQVGNELLNVGQLLVYVRDFENRHEAQSALDLFFDWLDAEQDPNTGLWGTNGYCDVYTAVYGGYHQLLLYYYCQRPVPYAERIIDITLSLQHGDGSFGREGAAGACEDVDAIDILVNLYKLTGYRPTGIRQALERSLPAILRNQMDDGSFVFERGSAYSHSGLLRTWVPPNQSHLQATWMRTHTLALISEIVHNQPLAEINWQFNDVCTVGWHRPGKLPEARAESSPIPIAIQEDESTSQPQIRFRRQLTDLVLPRLLLKHLPSQLLIRLLLALARRYYKALSTEAGLAFLLQFDEQVSDLVDQAASACRDGLHPRWWPGREHPVVSTRFSFAQHMLHLGCGEGSLSYDLATLSSARVLAIDQDSQKIAVARSYYRHPNLEFRCCESLSRVADNVFDLAVITMPATDMYETVMLCQQVFDQVHPDRILVHAIRAKDGWRQDLQRQMAIHDAARNGASDHFNLQIWHETLKAEGMYVTWHTVSWGQFWIELMQEARFQSKCVQVIDEVHAHG